MVLQEVLSHAYFALFVAYPKLLIIGAILEALTSSADMNSGFLADHTASLHPVVGIVTLALFGGCRAGEVTRSIQFRHDFTGQSSFSSNGLFSTLPESPSVKIIVNEIRK